MNLIKLYIDEVESYLPKRVQEDVAKELLSNLEEDLEVRMASGDWSTPEEAEVALLQELGPPHELADSYLPGPRVLFGPALYPPFIRTMKIALSIFAAVIALGLVVDFMRSGSVRDFWSALFGSIDNLVVGALIILGSVVAIFAFIERSAKSFPGDTKIWDPRDLGDEEEAEKVHLSEQIVGIAFLVLALVVLNIFPDRVGVFVHLDEHSGWVPMLNQAFWSHLWLLNICLGLDLWLQVLVLRRGKWTSALRWVRVVVSVLFVVWISQLVYGPSIFEVDLDRMVSHGWPEASVDRFGHIMHKTVLPILTILLRVGFVAAFITLGIRIYNATKASLGK